MMDEIRFTKRMRYAALASVISSIIWWLFTCVWYYVHRVLPDSGFTTAIIIGFIYGLAFPPFYARQTIDKP